MNEKPVATNQKTVAIDPADAAKPGRGVLSAKFAHWIVLYAAFLLLAGWAYLKAYFGIFGLDTGSLDLGFHDVILHGLVAITGAGASLAIAYLVILLLSVFAQIFYGNRSRIVDALLALTIVALFPITYEMAQFAGATQANEDRGDRTRLKTVAFTMGTCDYRGRLVYAKIESLYIYDLAYLVKPARSVRCPVDPTDTSIAVPQLWLFRTSDVKNARLVQ